MSESSRRGFVTGTIAAGAAALSAVPKRVQAGNMSAGFQGGGKQLQKYAVEVGNIGEGTAEEAIEYAQQLELEAISLPWNRVEGFSDTGNLDAARVKTIAQQIEDAGLVFDNMVTNIVREVMSGGAEAEKAFSTLRRNLDIMAVVKVKTLAAFAPVRRNTEWGQVVSFYNRLMKDLEPTGIRIASHTGGSLNSWDAMSRLVKAVPSPNNGFCYCTGNVWHAEFENLYNVPSEVASRIYYIHIRDVKTGQGEKEFWFDKGDIDFAKLLQSIRKMNYQGYLRSEHLPTDDYSQPTFQSNVSTAFAVGYMKALDQVL